MARVSWHCGVKEPIMLDIVVNCQLGRACHLMDEIEQILQGEMADYIENEKSRGNNLRRNGTSPKKRRKIKKR